MQNRKRVELVSYIFFTVLFSFFPVVCIYLIQAIDGHYLTIAEITQHGGVLTIVIVLAADAFSRLITSGSKWRDLKVVAASSSAWMIGCGSIAYAQRSLRTPRNPVFFENVAIALLIGSIAVATFCRLLPQGDE
jgi:hypothetical protein